MLAEIQHAIIDAPRQQNGLAAALREFGRIERTLFTLRWFESPALRKLITAELNKGEALNILRRNAKAAKRFLSRLEA